jgi:hypothetical protein
VGEVEARVEAEGHDGGRGVRSSLPGEDGHFALGVHAHRVVPAGERKDPVKAITLYPILQLAGNVAGICANLKHGHHHYFHRNGPWPGDGRDRESQKNERAEK